MHLHIIGGGIVGCTTAFMAARQGHAVTLSEQNAALGQGASGQALGLLIPFGTHVKGRSAAAQRTSITLWPALAQSLSEAAETPLETWFRTWSWQGTQAHQVNLPLLFPILHKALTAAGVQVELNAPVTLLEHPKSATATFLTAGMGNSALGVENLVLDSAQSLRLKSQHPLTEPLYDTESGLYLIPTFQGEVLLGSQSVPAGTQEPLPNVTQTLLTLAEKHKATLGRYEVTHVWVGHRPTHTPKLPLVRPMGQNTFAAAGLGRVGLGLAPLTAQEFLTALQPA